MFKLIAAIAAGTFIGGVGVAAAVTGAAVYQEQQRMIRDAKHVLAECDAADRRAAELRAKKETTSAAIIKNQKEWLIAIKVPGANKQALAESYIKKQDELEITNRNLDRADTSDELISLMCFGRRLEAKAAIRVLEGGQ